MKEKKLRVFVEYFAESTAACLVIMVQGNILALTISHLFIASQTGLLAGLVAGAGLLLSRVSKPWIIALVLGLITSVVDYYIHPGMFGSAMTEAAVTGLAAAILSFIVSSLLQVWRKKEVASS